MKLGTGSLRIGALVCVLTVASQVSATAQEGPQLFRIGVVKLRGGGQYDFEEAMKLLNGAYKKAGTPLRLVWRPAIFGEMAMAVTVTPIKGYAQFDGEGPMAQLTAADRAKYTTLMRNSVESAQYTLDEMVPALSIMGEQGAQPKLARVTTVRVVPGKNLEFEDLIRSTVLPAMKKAAVKNYWVHRTLLGGPMGQYTIVYAFDKWADLDKAPKLDQILGAEGFKQYLGKIAATVAHAENSVMSYDAALSYMQ